MIRVVCACGRVFKAEDRHAGKRTRCPVCGAALIIGQTPASSSSGEDIEVPSWWYPSEPQGQVDVGGLPTQSGSDPDLVRTAVFPTGQEPWPVPQPGNSSRLPRMMPGARMPVPIRPSSRVRRLWLLAAGTAALAIAALGVLWYWRSAAPGGGEPPAMAKGAPTAPARWRDPGRAGGIGDRGGPDRPAHRLRLLVPLYVYPGGAGRTEWQRLIAAAAKVEVVAIANPNSGPGLERNPDYAAIFTEAHRRGIRLVGYVNTQYAGRPRDEVKAELDTWVRLYPQIAGFFFDQQARDGQDTAYYAEIRDYARSRLPDPLVITNPGVPCDPAFLAQAVSDVTCVFANFEGFDHFQLPTPLKAFEASRFAALPYNIPDAESMRAVLKDAIYKRIGYIYVSDIPPPNRWGRLPSYWEAEVEAVSQD